MTTTSRVPPPWNYTRTWAAGDLVGAHACDAYMRDDLDHLATPPFAQASLLYAGTAIPSGTWTPVPFNASKFDTVGMHDYASQPSQMLITVGYPGIYKVSVSAVWDSVITLMRQVALYRNGVQIDVIVQQQKTNSLGMVGDYYLLCNAGDVLELWGYQDSIGSLNLDLGSTFTVRKVSNLPSIVTPAWVDTITFAALGALPTYTQINNYWGSDLDHLGTPISCQAAVTGVKSIPNATATAIAWDAENWDTNSIHSTSSNKSRFTIPTNFDGVYEVSCNVTYVASAAGTVRYVQIYKNGSAVALIANSEVINATYGAVCNGVYQIQCAAGDYLELFAYQDSGGSLNISAN